jgi:hypothetical protein
LHKWPGASATAPQFLQEYAMVKAPFRPMMSCRWKIHELSSWPFNSGKSGRERRLGSKSYPARRSAGHPQLKRNNIKPA